MRRGAKYFNTVNASSPDVKALHFKDAKSVGGFLKSVLDGGNCRGKLAELISEFSKASGVEAMTTDLETLFNQIIDQEKGGVTVNISQQLYLDDVIVEQLNADWGEGMFKSRRAPRNAMGLAMRVRNQRWRRPGGDIDFSNEAYVLIQEGVFNPSYAGSDYIAANKLAHLLIHELLHVAARTGTYGHDDDETGLQTAVKRLGSPTLADFLIKHCNVPKESGIGRTSRRRVR